MNIVRRWFSRPEEAAWDYPDILDHPDLKRMTLRELADLPMRRFGAHQEPAGAAAQDAAVTDLGRAAGK